MLNGVIPEPGYGSGKQGKERVFVTTDELPKLSGQVGNFLRWNDHQNVSGIFNAVNLGGKFPSSAGENTTNANITIAFGGNVAHENLPPCVAAYGWRRTA